MLTALEPDDGSRDAYVVTTIELVVGSDIFSYLCLCFDLSNQIFVTVLHFTRPLGKIFLSAIVRGGSGETEWKDLLEESL